MSRGHHSTAEPQESSGHPITIPNTAIEMVWQRGSSLEVDEALGAVKVLRRVVEEEELAETIPFPRSAGILEGGMGHVRLQAELFILFLRVGGEGRVYCGFVKGFSIGWGWDKTIST